MKRIVTIALISCLTFAALISGLSLNNTQSKVHANSEMTTQHIGANDVVTVPIVNLAIYDFQHAYPKTHDNCEKEGHSESFCEISATLLKFVFKNGEELLEVPFEVYGKPKRGSAVWMENDSGEKVREWIWTYTNYIPEFCIQVEVISNGLVLTYNPNRSAEYDFDEVTIHTYQASFTVTSGYVIPGEFLVSFKDIEGNIIAVIETVNRYISPDLIPNAPQINLRPFLRWTNVQGYKLDEVIISNVTFFPLYGFNPDYVVDGDPAEQPDESSENYTSTWVVLGVVIIGIVLIVIIVSRRKSK